MGQGVLSKLSIAASPVQTAVKKLLFKQLDVDTVTALGTDQGTATALTAGKNMVLAADGTVGVALPPAIEGMTALVVNTVSNQTLKVYAADPDTINAAATGDAFSVTAGGTGTFHCDVRGHWYAPVSNATGTATSASTAELDVLDGALATNLVAAKAAITTTNGGLTLGGSVTAVGSFIIGAADLNETDLEKLDGITNGTIAASKAVVANTDANIGIVKATELHIGATGAETQVTATGAELNFVDTTAGTGAASKAVVLDSGEDYTWPSTGILTYGVLKDPAGTTVTALGRELNDLDASVKSVYFDDFRGTWAIGDAGPADYWSTTAGSGTNNELATTVSASLCGEVTMKSASDDGTNAANNTSLTGINLGWKANQGGLAIETRLKIDDITEAYVFVGFTDVISTTVESPITFTDGTDTLIADANDACGIVFTGDSTTQEFAHGGVKATTPTAGAFAGVAPVNGTYVVLRVEVSATGGVRGFVNGTAIGVEIANAVTATTALTPAVIVGNTAAAQTIMTVDYVKTEQNR